PGAAWRRDLGDHRSRDPGRDHPRPPRHPRCPPGGPARRGCRSRRPDRPRQNDDTVSARRAALRFDATPARSTGDAAKGANMKREEREKRPVTVFGAGIAGLTAAHELAMRGFDVEVIDADYNAEWEDLDISFDRGVGGMARSQWGIAL